MARELLVLRHAKSEWDTGAPSDFERPLSKRGRKDAPRMGEWLEENGLAPDEIVCSTARRAKQTAKLLGLCDPRYDERVYEASLETLLEVLAECKAARVMIVGHNPGLESLVWHLGGETVKPPDDGKVFPTSALAHLELPDDWAALEPGAGKLKTLLHPRDL